MNLAWDLKDLEELHEEERVLLAELSVLQDLLGSEECINDTNLPRRPTTLRKRLTAMTKALSRHKRAAATHVFVFMIGTEDRMKKPYSIPVQCIPYKGLSDEKVSYKMVLCTNEYGDMDTFWPLFRGCPLLKNA